MTTLLFVFGNIWGLIGTLVLSILLIYLVEKEHLILPGISFSLSFLLLIFLIKKDLFGYIDRNPLSIVACVIVYLAIGFLWSFVKWWLFVKKEYTSYKMKRYEWLKSIREKKDEYPDVENILKVVTPWTPVPDEYKQDWLKRIGLFNKPEISKHKNKTAVWVLYWPISVIWFLLHDFVVKIIRRLINSFKQVYSAITKNVFKYAVELDNE